MIAKKVLVVGGLVAALAVPAGVAVAAAATPSPGPAPTSQPSQPGPGYGPGPGLGYGSMMGGSGGPQGCPYYNSPKMQQHRAGMWAPRTGATLP